MIVSFYLADLNPAKDKSIGISNYAKGLMNALAHQDSVALASVDSTSSVGCQAVERRMIIPFRTDFLPLRMAADLLSGPCFGMLDSDLVHFPKGMVPPAFRSRKKVVITIHDMILVHYWKFYRGERSRTEWGYWIWVLKRSINLCDAIITVSEHARSQIVDFIDEHGLRSPPIHVTYEGIIFEDRVCEAVTIAPALSGCSERPYFIVFGSDLPHKKTERLLELWEAREVALEYDLRIVGRLSDSVVGKHADRGDVELMGYLSQEDLVQAIGGSRGLVMPSEIEGFGLPVVEAVALGKAAIVVEGTSCHELLADRGDLCFRLDCPDSFDAALLSMLRLSDEEVSRLRDELTRRFSWKRVARSTVSVYESVLKP